MTKREARLEAAGIVHDMIAEYFAAGQPWDDHADRDVPPRDTERLAAALRSIQDEMARHNGARRRAALRGKE